jgi:uncharacterized protein
MKNKLLEFIDQLRGAGVCASVAESLDAMRAAGMLGIEREALRAGLAATLIKDEADRPTFDALFDRFFAAPGRERGKGRPQQPLGEGQGQGRGVPTAGERPHEETSSKQRGEPQGPSEHLEPRQGREHAHATRLARRRELLDIPFEAMDARAVEEASQLVEELAQRLRAHLSRRYERAGRGRLDFRRTIRASLGSGGVPIDPAFRARRPGKVDLVALCDLSYSTATAADFCLALLAPASECFRHVHLFGYVDRLVEISFERGHVVPHEPLDLAARSDFGQVLRQLWDRWCTALTRNTVVLVLGDARNNRRPPRADIVARIRIQVRRVFWLNPESLARWNTGDSVIASYARHCDAILAAGNLHELSKALKSHLY